MPAMPSARQRLAAVVMNLATFRVAAWRPCIGLSMLWALQAHAALGGGDSSIRADQSELHGVLTITPRRNYELREITNESGMVVREFVNRSGLVFALAWSGPAMPNLRQLLGAHYEAYAQSLARLSRPGLHRSVRVETPHLVVENAGHLRAYAGYGLLTDLLPAGMSPTEVR